MPSDERSTVASPPAWLNATVQYQGFPLALRVRPGAGTPEQRARLSVLAIVTHRFAHVRADGMPEPDYNYGLAELDGAIINALETDGGVVVVIDTRGGRRNYYAYTTASAASDAAWTAARAAHPGHALELERRGDAAWSLFADYRRRFKF